MKITKQISLFLLLFTGIGNAQNGLGTLAPDSSSILELASTSKGLLAPRMNTEQRDLILNPAKGLVVFNTTTNVLEQNSGTAILKNWTSISDISNVNSGFDSIIAVGEVITNSNLEEIVPQMKLSPPEGTYLVSFESQYNNAKVDLTTVVNSGGISTDQGVKDLENIYNQLNSKIVTNATHGAILGNGETLIQGVYSMPSAVSLLATLT
jgi:hypothetical protein